jgi:hypothetical protein
MSKAYEIAAGMAAHLNAVAALDGVESIVDRQLDIATEIQKRVFLMAAKGRGKGAMISIFYTGFQNPDASAAATPNITRTYLVSIYGAPTLKSGHTPADDLVETVALHLHRWEPAEAHGIAEIHVLNGEARPDSDYLIYDVEVRVTGRL